MVLKISIFLIVLNDFLLENICCCYIPFHLRIHFVFSFLHQLIKIPFEKKNK